jgi:hypothetical protein
MSLNWFSLAGAPWTASWIRGGTGCPAWVSGYTMVLDSYATSSYPAALPSQEEGAYIVGRRITFADNLFAYVLSMLYLCMM